MNFNLIPVAHAQTIGGIVDSIIDLLNDYIIPILFAIATIVFLWGVILYITAGGDEEKRKEGRNYIIFGLIGFFVFPGDKISETILNVSGINKYPKIRAGKYRYI